MIIILIILLYGRFVEPNTLVTNHIEIEIEGLPKNFEGRRIVQISDLHGKKYGDKLARKINDIEPDFVVVTGDVIDKYHPDYNYIVRTLKPIKAEMGKFYIAGNNEHTKALSMDKIEAVVETAGFQNLNNTNQRIKIGKEHLWMVGVDDPNDGYDDLQKALEKTDSAPKILLAHSPEIIYKAADEDIEMVLVGHTHGGQVYIPVLSQSPEIAKLLIPLGRIFKNNMAPGFEKYIAGGLYKGHNTQMYVNRGLGETRISFRLFAPPEITVITLKGKT